ncbi:hypothetical protein ATK74_1757 [Propionicimonas paludicola]|uniref:Uncharacterized protein n=1 Tax=Propionicimonas paludicola TaxID=185243 RepID=A0A2A9CRZ0_9ACTN|nr:hypothetical protein [Propionicimonas paludicola]PFG17194.1 hypothetical protein ATK74_1757 [Propionicimonas paludicola]
MPRRAVSKPVEEPKPDEVQPQPVVEPAPVSATEADVPEAGPVEEPKADELERLTVLSVFAHATLKTGEVKMLSKGDVVEADKYDEKSMAHLRAIGFIG